MSTEPQPIRALIFDMDELLVASSPIWRAAEEHLLEVIGHRFTPELAAQYKGMNALDVAATIHRLLKPNLPLEQCQKILRDRLIEAFAGEVRPMPGAVELARRVGARWPAAVASGSPLTAITGALRRLEIHDCFRVILTSESVPRGKPHPDVFLAAADALGVPPAQCLVFEDSLVGVRAARAAGMRCFAVPSSTPDQIRQIATRVYPSLEQVQDHHIEQA
jgi:HAD superfamily hydrolase (TIGR01509 family)